MKKKLLFPFLFVLGIICFECYSFSQDFIHDYLTPSCPDVTVNFQYTVNDPNATFLYWDFGDGNTDFGANFNVSNTFLNSGTFTVTLYVLDVNYNIISTTSSDIDVLGDINWITTNTNYAMTGQNILFSTQGDGNISSIYWDFGDGNFSSEMSPSHSYSLNGTYLVNATINSTCGQDILTTQLIISDYSFTYSANDSCANSLFNFQSNVSDTNGLIIDWDFGDGNVSNYFNPSHVFSLPGDYYVTMIISDNQWNIIGGYTDTVHVFGELYTIVSNPMSASPNTPILFSLTGDTTPSSVLWDFGDGNTSTELSPSHAFATTGQYNVSATVPTSCGNITYYTNIYISNIDFTYTLSSNCSPADVSFQYTGTEVGVTQLYWEFGDGSSSCCDQLNPSNSYSNGGDYLVTLWAYDDNWNSLGMAVKSIHLGQSYNSEIFHSTCNSYTWNGQTYTTSGDYTFNGQTQDLCDSIVVLHLTIDDNITNNIYVNSCQSYTWAENGNTYTQSGLYSVTYTSSQGCDSIVQLNLNIGTPSSSDIYENVCGSYFWNITNQSYDISGDYIATIQNIYGCDSTITLHLTITEPYQTTVNEVACNFYIWDLNGQFYLNSGTYTEVVSAVNGCDSIVTLNLEIAYTSFGNDTQSSCDVFTWSANGETYFESGTYTATIPSASGCDSIVTLDLTIYNIDNTVTLNGSTLTANETNAEYQWLDCNNGNTPILGAIQQSFTPTQSGNYAVRVTKNSCIETSDCVIISINNLYENNIEDLYLYPNPFDDFIYVSNNIQVNYYSIYEINGKEICLNQKVIDGKINTINLEKGVYFIKLQTSNTNKRIKVIKR